MFKATVSADFMQAIFEYLASRGVGELRVLNELGCRDKKTLIHEGRVAVDVYEHLFDIGEALTGDRYFGLNMGASPYPRTWGLVSHLAMSAPNPLMAVTALMNYSQLHLDFAHFEMAETAAEELVLSWHNHSGRPVNRHLVEHIFANILELAQSQMGYPAGRVRIEFVHHDAGDPLHVEQVLNASVDFSRRCDRTFVSLNFLQLPSLFGRKDLYAITEDLVSRRLAELRGEDKLINATRETILKQLPTGLPKIGDTARALQMAPRTLQRRLQDRHIKYQTLLDEVRRELAQQLIVKPRMSLNEVADYLGFNDQSAFQHAFKRWEGTTPGRFRKIQQAL